VKFKKINAHRAVIDNFISSIILLRVAGVIGLLALIVTATDIRNPDFPALGWCFGLTLCWHLLFAQSRIFVDLNSDSLEFKIHSLYFLSKRRYRLSEIVSVIVCKHPFKRGYYQLIVEFNNLAKLPIAYSRAELALVDVAQKMGTFTSINVHVKS